MSMLILTNLAFLAGWVRSVQLLRRSRSRVAGCIAEIYIGRATLASRADATRELANAIRSAGILALPIDATPIVVLRTATKVIRVIAVCTNEIDAEDSADAQPKE